MTVSREFFNWSAKQEDVEYDRCSPNLIQLGSYLGKRWAMVNNGCYVERDIRDGSVPSAHSHGAAIDRNYVHGRPEALNEIIPFLIDFSKELHVQAIHDYFGCRIWRAGRTTDLAEAHSTWWKAQTPDSYMGQAWATYFHIETNFTGWHDDTDVAIRLGGSPLPPPVPPTSTGGLVFPRTLRIGDTGPDVATMQTGLRLPGSVNGDKNIVVDGKFGQQTQNAVKSFQKLWGLTQDGIFGPQSQAKMMLVLNA